MGIKDIRAFGVIGTDPFGAEMVRIMKADRNTDQKYAGTGRRLVYPYLCQTIY